MEDKVWKRLEVICYPAKRMFQMSAGVLERCTQRAEAEMGDEAARKGWLACLVWGLDRMVVPKSAPAVLAACCQYFATRIKDEGKAARLRAAADLLLGEPVRTCPSCGRPMALVADTDGYDDVQYWWECSCGRRDRKEGA